MKPIHRERQESSPRYRRGDLVSVRSPCEIHATLDANGKLEGLPFMPEMARFCGGTFRVYRRARRTCVEGNGIRRMENAVLLEGLRCTGAAHQGCQRGCLIFWKEAWLTRATASAADETPAPGETEALSGLRTFRDDRFFCQSTELVGATFPMAVANIRYYLGDLWIGESKLWPLFYVIWFNCINKMWQAVFRRDYYRRLTGAEGTTPDHVLNLKPGELVEVRSAREIQATLDEEGRNRGLRFEAEMASYCGKRYRVGIPLTTIIDEKTGKMQQLKNTVTLEGGTCQGLCASNCPRANFFYWREVWLKRVATSIAPGSRG